MERDAKFLLEYLKKHKEDRGMMADLRKGFSETTAIRAWPYIAHFCDIKNDFKRIIYQTIMAAYAFNPEVTNKGNIGDVMRVIASGDGRGQEGLKSFDGRFRRLLICADATEVCRQIRGVILTASRKGIPVDYITLFKDLWFWGDKVKIKWAGSYWADHSEGVKDEIPDKNNR